jgi:hypothetical protein
MKLLLLLLPLFAHAKPWKQVWEVRFDTAPRFAFYDATSSNVLVALDGAAVRRISLQGEAEKENFAEAEGTPGPMRAYGGRIYWAIGKTIYSFPADGGRLRKEAEASAPVLDLSLDAKGKLFVAGAKGVGEPKKEYGAAATSLFALSADLFTLRGGNVSGPAKERKICDQAAFGLERSPDGKWVTVCGKRVSREGETLVEGKTKPGRIAYVYRKESQYDLLVVPFPEEKVVRAYQSEEAGK